MTGAKGTGRRANANQSPPSSQTQSRRTNFGFEALCVNVGDLCNVDSDEEDVIPKIQEMLKEKATGTGQKLCHSCGCDSAVTTRHEGHNGNCGKETFQH